MGRWLGVRNPAGGIPSLTAYPLSGALNFPKVNCGVSQPRCCHSAGSLRSTAIAPGISPYGQLFCDLRSDFAFNELSSHVIRAANSRLGEAKRSRRSNFQVHAKSDNDDGPPPQYRTGFILLEKSMPHRSMIMFYQSMMDAEGKGKGSLTGTGTFENYMESIGMIARILTSDSIRLETTVERGPTYPNSREHFVLSSDTKIRSEVISPFRSLRMFFYLAFIASGTIGSLITLTRFAAALGNSPNAQPIPDIFKDLGIDLAAVAIFFVLYRSDAKARDASYAKLSREEILSTLRVELANKRVVTLQQLRGIARIVIISGPRDYIQEAFLRGEPFKEDLLERGVLVVPYSLDGPLSSAELIASTGKQGEGSVAVQEQPKVTATERWIATPIYTNEWSRWLNAQKKLANVSEDKPVYISLRLDGRVRGSGVGYPPWERFSVQLPPMAGIWKGPLDGMDGRI